MIPNPSAKILPHQISFYHARYIIIIPGKLLSHQILLPQMPEKIAAFLLYLIRKNNCCWVLPTYCCKKLYREKWLPKISKQMLTKLPREIAAETHQKYCCESFPEKIAAKSQENIAAKADQRKCCTAVLTNRNVALRSKLTKNLLVCMITVGEAAGKLRRTISSNKDF